jgi:hypothetical protein
MTEQTRERNFQYYQTPYIKMPRTGESQRIETPTERQEIRDQRRYLKKDGRFRNIVRTVHRLQEGPERREALRKFWEDVYDDQLVQAQEEQMSLRGHVLAEYVALEDEERRETGREFKVTHPHSPHVPKALPLRGSRSAGVRRFRPEVGRCQCSCLSRRTLAQLRYAPRRIRLCLVQGRNQDLRVRLHAPSGDIQRR